MGRDTGNVLGGLAIILVGTGAVLSAVLFYFMFKYADEANLFMVILTTALIAVVSMGVAKGLIFISRNKFSK
ncbi:hypothetical protein [Methanosarcina sp.]|uniref:hypothetical protein n=1 Tax=Methanosarcina sp. TaxID=2213 RepID=UPI003BB6C8BA